MKYYLLLTDTKVLLSSAVLNEVGLKKLRSMVKEPFEVEETTEFDANSYEFVSARELDDDPRCGERNVFYDVNGNEFHN